MSDAVIGPEQVEQSIRQLSEQIARGVRIVSDNEESYLAADREYDRLFASAYLAAPGPQAEKKYRAEIATTMARRVRDEAYAKYKYANRRAEALELELRAMQSIGASLRTVYGVAGRGEGS